MLLFDAYSSQIQKNFKAACNFISEKESSTLYEKIADVVKQISRQNLISHPLIKILITTFSKTVKKLIWLSYRTKTNYLNISLSILFSKR